MYIVCLNVINLTKMAWMVIHFLSRCSGGGRGGLAFWNFSKLEIVIFVVLKREEVRGGRRWWVSKCTSRTHVSVGLFFYFIFLK